MRRLLPLVIVSGMLTAGDLKAAPASSQPATNPALDERPIRLMDDPVIERARGIAAIWDDADSLRSVRDHRRRLRAQARTLTAVDDRIQMALASANWELAEVAAPIATRWILGYRTAEDLRSLRQAAESAGRALESAKRALDALPDTDDKAAARKHARWRDALATLRTFAAAHDALSRGVPESADAVPQAQETCRDAALGLAELRENEDPDIAAAARLWQAILLEAGGRTGRTLATLDLALAPPERLPYDFFNRVLRCHLLAERGSYALAAAMALRMQEECARWFDKDTTAGLRAKMTLIALRANCMWRWADALRASDPAEADERRKQGDALVAANFPADQPGRIYWLEHAIPILLTPPAVREAPDDTDASAPDRPPDSDMGAPKAAQTSPTEVHEPAPTKPAPSSDDR